ncbi:MAG: ATP synthase F1 subunit gamma [bacterium]|nr:ATP synthase F1 subunit gamma [bacterium]
MENIQNLKKRIRSVGNINKITKAMELVAATKMRRSQEIALASRPYALTALDLLANVSLMQKKDLPELLKKRKVKKTLFVLVASDKGLAGAFNGSLFKKFESFARGRASGELGDFVAVGEKTNVYLLRKGFNVIKKFVNVGDYTTTQQVEPIADFLVEGYLAHNWDKVVVFSTHFKSALKQEALVREILPVNFDATKNTIKDITPETGKFAETIKEQNIDFSNGNKKEKADYLIEPSGKTVLEGLAKHLLFMQVYHLILEANASEHSARRMAMKTASDNASDLSQALQLQYNKSRQAGITNQIIEISAGAEALN